MNISSCFLTNAMMNMLCANKCLRKDLYHQDPNRWKYCSGDTVDMFKGGAMYFLSSLTDAMVLASFFHDRKHKAGIYSDEHDEDGAPWVVISNYHLQTDPVGDNIKTPTINNIQYDSDHDKTHDVIRCDLCEDFICLHCENFRYHFVWDDDRHGHLCENCEDSENLNSTQDTDEDYSSDQDTDED